MYKPNISLSRNNVYPLIDLLVIFLWSIVFQPIFVERFEINNVEKFIDWLNISTILLPVLQFGLLASFTRFYNNWDKTTLLFLILTLHLILITVLSPILSHFGVAMDIILYCFSNFLLSLFLYLNRFENNLIKYGFISLIFPLAYGILLFSNNQIIFKDFTLAINTASSAIILIYIITLIKLSRRIRQVLISKELVKSILEYSTNAYLGSILLLVMGRILVYFSKTNLGIEEYTLFSILLTFSNIPVVISGLITKVFINELYDDNKQKAKIYKKYFKIYIPLILLIILIFPLVAEKIYPSLPQIRTYSTIILLLKSTEQFTTYVEWNLQNNHNLKRLYLIYLIPLLSFTLTIAMPKINSLLLIYYFSISLVLHLIIKNKKLYQSLYV